MKLEKYLKILAIPHVRLVLAKIKHSKYKCESFWYHVRSLYKGLVRLAFIDYNYSLDMFPKLVSIILKRLKNDRKEIDMIIYSRIEERKLTKIIYHFQIYYLTHIQFSDKDGILKNKPIGDFDMEDYILVLIDQVILWQVTKLITHLLCRQY